MDPLLVIPDTVRPSASSPSATPLVTTLAPRKVTEGEPSEERVEAIAALLEKAPRGLGASIEHRAAWEVFPNPGKILAAAEVDLGKPTPALPDELYLALSRTGIRADYEEPYCERTSRLSRFALAECLENKGRFLPAAEAELAAIFRERSWTVPSHDRELASFHGQPILDLGAAMRAWTLATADHLLGDRLGEETRAELRRQVHRRIFDVYRAQVRGPYLGSLEWWHVWDSNWNAVCHAGVVGAALALLPEARERAWFVAAAELYSANFLSGFSPDGYCSEGVGYWSYGFGHYVAMAETIGRATAWRLNFLTPEIVRRVVSFPERIELVPGVYPSFSDNRPNRQPLPWVRPLVAMRLGSGAYDRQAIGFEGLAVHPLGAMLYETMIVAMAGGPSNNASAGTRTLPLRDHFPEAGVVLSRTADSTAQSGWALAFKGGHNAELHNHNDIGSYVLAVDGRAMLVDPGMEIYTPSTFGPRRYESAMHNSYGHPVPVVAGHLQETGRQARGTMTVVETSEKADVYSLDFTAAYAGSVPSLKKLHRRVEFTRLPTPALHVIDEVEYDTPQTFETALITFGHPQIVSPDTIIIREATSTIRIQITGSAKITLHEETLDENLPSHQKPKRIALRVEEPAAGAKVSYRIERQA